MFGFLPFTFAHAEPVIARMADVKEESLVLLDSKIAEPLPRILDARRTEDEPQRR